MTAKHSPYLTEILSNPQDTVDAAVTTLQRIDKETPFDAIVVTGVSGLLIGPTLAYLLGKRLCVVRKDDDKANHAITRIESGMEKNDQWIFVDDLIASGDTMKVVCAKISDAGYGRTGNGFYMFRENYYSHGGLY